MTEKLKLSRFAMKGQAFQVFQIQKPSFLIEILNFISKNQVFNFQKC